MDALTFLRQDHKSVLGMLEVLDGATNLVIAESQHEAVEEQFFWPAVRKALEDGDALADAAAQEQEGKKLLQQLEHATPGQPQYQQALQAFVRAGREHIEFEQSWSRWAISLKRP